MSKLKLALSYILGFVCSILLVLIALLSVARMTIYNKGYILNRLEDSKYYDKVYKEIGKEMKNNLRSSGLDESVISDLYNSSDVKNDIKNIVGAIYSDSKFTVDTASIEKKLISNIDNYLEKNNIVLTDKSSLDSYVSNVISVYEKEVSLYGYIENYVHKFIKIGDILELLIGVFIILFVVFVLINKYVNKKNFFDISFIGSSFMLLYFRYFIFDKVDFKNILIISDAFSDFIRNLILDIDVYISEFAYLCMGLGILFVVFTSFREKRKKKVRSS